ncbi:Uncharacterised MFS-type transporter YbfB [Williamsia sterculiae]|uniref:Uncharacterized MFS-type transporter YbfB n=2 Tax=Williamsia sterculiae TaxID=1344003 RepID=A0A1N7HCJ5_9NOCA|nr:Uncharacterised MFS-type transporter YbfB [Williamsia sterculiae]
MTWSVAGGLAAAMGIGRFVFTPLLPLMHGALGAQDGALVATANYVGYLLGALLLAARPSLNSTRGFRVWAVLLVVSELAIALTGRSGHGLDVVSMSLLRGVAGFASGVLFVGCASVLAAHRARGASPGLAFSGVGTGIAVSGLYVLALGHLLSWQQLWIGSALLTAVLIGPLLWQRIPAEATGVQAHHRAAGTTGAWRLLLVSYFCEGLGYIIVGTFLVVAVAGQGNSTLGPVVWVIVGVSCAPGAVLWHAIGARLGTRRALWVALVVQAIGAVLPAVTSSSAGAIVAAVTFGGTFIGITVLTLAAGAGLGVGRSASRLTAVYGVGQVLGPLVVAPVIGSSYVVAFAVAGVVIAIAAAAAVAASLIQVSAAD